MKEKEFYVTKEQMLEILKKNVLPTYPFETRILHTIDDKYIVMAFNPSKGEGQMISPKINEYDEDEEWLDTVLGPKSDKCVTEKIDIELPKDLSDIGVKQCEMCFKIGELKTEEDVNKMLDRFRSDLANATKDVFILDKTEEIIETLVFFLNQGDVSGTSCDPNRVYFYNFNIEDNDNDTVWFSFYKYK